MNTLRARLIRFVAFAVTGLVTTAALAPDPPGRVGRISHIEGSVSMHVDTESGWQPATLNHPITSENSLWTEAASRAEVRVGSTSLRIGSGSVLDIQRLDDTDTVAYLQRGVANIRIGILERQDSYRVVTPQGQILLKGSGNYRIEADADRNDSRVTVFAGSARIEAAGALLTVEPGRTAVVQINAGRAGITFEHVARTDFDDWAQLRDERWDSRQVEYVSPQMTGYEELNDHGNWVEEDELGRVWVPRDVAEDWAPYRYGRWSYVRPWGWTWIDDAPWGFAPFHYGRWVQVRGRWGWWPGNRIYRPVYSPALVAWVGNPGWNVSFSGGYGPGIGWLPLAPWEAYVPWYTNNDRYIHNINYIYINRPVVVKPPRQYRNHKPGATVVSHTTFHASAPVARNRVRIDGESMWTQPVRQDGAGLPQRVRRPDMQARPDGRGPARPAPVHTGAPLARPAARTELGARPQATPKPLPLQTQQPSHSSMPDASIRQSRQIPTTQPKPNYVAPQDTTRPIQRYPRPGQEASGRPRSSGETVRTQPSTQPRPTAVSPREPSANIRRSPESQPPRVQPQPHGNPAPAQRASPPAPVQQPRPHQAEQRAPQPEAERPRSNKGPRTVEQ